MAGEAGVPRQVLHRAATDLELSARESAASAAISAYTRFKRGRDNAWSLLVGRAFASFGEHSRLALPIRLVGVERIAIGSGVFIGPNSWLQTMPEPGYTAMLSIGDDTSIAGSVVISAVHRITLGKGVLLAKNVYISDHGHAYGREDLPMKDQGIGSVAPVRIEDRAWLGQGVVVVPGVTIGAGCVIGANSVVTKSVPARSLAVGAPARVVRNLDEQR